MVEQGPVLDGRLNDACWRQAAVASDFTFSRLGVPASQKTEVYICQDAEHLHIAFHCLDDRHEGIRSFQRHRDGPMDQDDHIEVFLDTANRRTGFSSFRVNPLGTQSDQMEGGTATKVQWKGDWHAAASVTPDGWVAEISIPFNILKYPTGATVFGVNFRRHHQRLQEDYYWMDIGQGRSYIRDKFEELSGLKLPAKVIKFSPRIMPYLINSATSSGRVDGNFGMDIKQELVEGLTGLASIRPDFSTIARSLESIGFSYTQQYLDDTRPFFQEGSRYFGSPWFYSNSVGEMDLGTKLYGQWRGLEVGFLNAALFSQRNDTVISLRRPSATGWGGGLSLVRRAEEGWGENNVFAFNLGHPLGGEMGWANAGISRSATSGPGGDGLQWNVSAGANTKFWRGWMQYENFSPDFEARDGYIQWPGSRNWRGNIGYEQTFSASTGSGSALKLRQSSIRWMFNKVNYYKGGLLHEDTGLRWRLRFRQPYGLNLGYTVGRHDNEQGGFHRDRLANIGLEIGDDPRQTTQLQYQFGRQGSRDYVFLNLSQSIAINQKLTFGITHSFARLEADDGTAEQRRRDILWISYDLSSERSLSSTLIRNDGRNNLYLSFRQAVRQGTDMFFLYGDPNSETTVNQLICKFVYAL